MLVAYDHASETVRTFSVSRVTGIADLDAVDA
jgi:predicted DNA-binding transcriptional regulator YafY